MGYSIKRQPETVSTITVSDKIRVYDASSGIESQATVQTLSDAIVLASGSARSTASYRKRVADGQSTATTSAQYFFEPYNDITLVEVGYVTAGNLTANDSNYATLLLQKADGAGGSLSTVASVTTETTGSGNWTLGTKVVLTISSASITAGEILAFTITKTGTGVIVPSGIIQVTYDIA